MPASNVHKAATGTGWVGVALLLIDKLEAWMNPSTVQVLATQYSENLRIIAESCQP
jgi:hypothetical protein